MSDMIPAAKPSFDDTSELVRRFCAERLYALEQSLRPWVDGSFGDILPAHVTNYISTLKELASLYEAHKRPRPDDELIPAAQMQQRLDEQQRMLELERDAAVAEAEQRVRRELEAGQRLRLEEARDTVSSRLLALQQRVPQG
jgi:hypothetical protein